MSERSALAPLAEGALVAALAAVLALLGIVLPPLQVITNILWIVPIVVLVVRQDLRTGVLATLVAGILVGIFSGIFNALFLFIQFAGLGLLYGYLFKREVPPGIMVAAGSVMVLFSLLFSLFLSIHILGWSSLDLLEDLKHLPDRVLDFYKRSGLLDRFLQQGNTLEDLRRSLEVTVNYIKLLLPGMLVLVSLFMALINYLVSEAVLRRLNLRNRVLPPFRYWQLPWYAIWGFIGGLALWLAGDYWHLDFLRIVGLNILYFYFPLLAGNGLALVAFWAHRFPWPGALKLMVFLFLLFNLPLGLLVLATLGLVDTLAGWRREPEKGS
ncbi:MAG: YybS family protein [Thermanaeromonas sp.]|uniref:YybS family protein n=1 Tax=Thermanaeromonas sp. TaxID=2003697 RepID=UPI002437AB61|nr:YybS family protein [Thermanaeromonas sp.]MCG0277653.1 YybS family protein [Thermanaeromonas sp.]